MALREESSLRLKPQRDEFGADLPADPMERLVHFARLAPSSHNSQPWKFVLERDAIDVFADLSRALPVADRERRELYVSLGCAIESLLIAADYEGYGAEARLFPVAGDESYACRVEIRRAGPKRDNAAAALLRAAPGRHTSHRPFDRAKTVPGRDLDWLRGAADGDAVALHFLGEGERGALEALLGRAEAILFSDPGYREELGRWIGEGALGTPWLLSKLGQFALAQLGVNERLAKADAGRLASAPHLALLSTRADGRADQVRAGQAFLRIALMAETRGIRTQPFSPPLELADARAEASRLFGIGGRHAQHLFRLGYAEAEKARTGRRPLAEILVRAG